MTYMGFLIGVFILLMYVNLNENIKSGRQENKELHNRNYYKTKE